MGTLSSSEATSHGLPHDKVTTRVQTDSVRWFRLQQNARRVVS